MPTTTIKAGENTVINLAVRDDDGNIIPTSEIQSLTVALVYQACSCDEEGDVLGTWTFTGPSTYSDGMAANGDGMFKIEVLSAQTLVPGLLSLVTTLAVLDPAYFVSGSEKSKTVTEDVLEILAVPSMAADDDDDDDDDDDTDDNFADDNGDLFADDNGDLMVG